GHSGTGTQTGRSGVRRRTLTFTAGPHAGAPAGAAGGLTVSDSSKPEIAREAGTKTARSPTPPESLEGVPVTVLLCLLVSRAYRALATGCAAVRQGFGTATAKLRVSRPNWRMP